MSPYSYAHLPGVTGSYVSTPDSVALSVTGDIDICVKVALADWTPTATTALAAKWTSTGNQRSYRFDITTDGHFQFLVSLDGVGFVQAISSVVSSITDGYAKWARATRVATTGVVKFYTSDDGLSWTQLGSSVTATGGAIYDSTQLFEIGSIYSGTAECATGDFYRVTIYSDLTSTTLVFDADFSNMNGTTTFSESSSNAATVTLHGSVIQVIASTSTATALGTLGYIGYILN